jgi:hypothetical protein
VAVSAHFFGTSYAPAGRIRPATLALALQYGVQDCVHEQPARLRYFDALQVTLEADANLLFGSTDLAFTPSKILAVLAAGRPVLALAPAGSAMIQRLVKLGQPCVVFPAAGPDAVSIAAATDYLRTLATSQVPVPPAVQLDRYSARAVSLQQLEIFTAVSSPG